VNKFLSKFGKQFSFVGKKFAKNFIIGYYPDVMIWRRSSTNGPKDTYEVCIIFIFVLFLFTFTLEIGIDPLIL